MWNKIFISGFMGTGKTVVGKELAKKLRFPFYDLDHEIEKKEKLTISLIFNRFGEEYFRSLEKKYLDIVASEQNFVLSLGGGAICSDQMIKKVKEYGTLVFIQTPLPVILERLKRNKKRPLLLDEKGELRSDEDLKEIITKLYNERLKWYKQADIIIDVQSVYHPSEIAEKVLHEIKELENKRDNN